jgi:hypothetical protein
MDKLQFIGELMGLLMGIGNGVQHVNLPAMDNGSTVPGVDSESDQIALDIKYLLRWEWLKYYEFEWLK